MKSKDEMLASMWRYRQRGVCRYFYFVMAIAVIVVSTATMLGDGNDRFANMQRNEQHMPAGDTESTGFVFVLPSILGLLERPAKPNTVTDRDHEKGEHIGRPKRVSTDVSNNELLPRQQKRRKLRHNHLPRGNIFADRRSHNRSEGKASKASKEGGNSGSSRKKSSASASKNQETPTSTEMTLSTVSTLVSVSFPTIDKAALPMTQQDMDTMTALLCHHVEQTAGNILESGAPLLNSKGVHCDVAETGPSSGGDDAPFLVQYRITAKISDDSTFLPGPDAIATIACLALTDQSKNDPFVHNLARLAKRTSPFVGLQEFQCAGTADADSIALDVDTLMPSPTPVTMAPSTFSPTTRPTLTPRTVVPASVVVTIDAGSNSDLLLGDEDTIRDNLSRSVCRHFQSAVVDVIDSGAPLLQAEDAQCTVRSATRDAEGTWTLAVDVPVQFSPNSRFIPNTMATSTLVCLSLDDPSAVDSLAPGLGIDMSVQCEAEDVAVPPPAGGSTSPPAVTPLPTRVPAMTRAPASLSPTKTLKKVAKTSNPTIPPAPTQAPTLIATASPSTNRPSKAPIRSPTKQPTSAPTARPTRAPTTMPTKSPSTLGPSAGPTRNRTISPTGIPSKSPTKTPIRVPTQSPIPPTSSPSRAETGTPVGGSTEVPTEQPTSAPSKSSSTTQAPTVSPTRQTSAPSPPPTDLALDDTAPPTAQPTKTLSGILVSASPFSVEYITSTVGEVSANDLETVTGATCQHIRKGTEDMFVSNDSFILLEGVKCEKQVATNTPPLAILYDVSVAFSDSSIIVLTPEDIDVMISTFFEKPAVNELLGTLAGLSSETFASTESVAYSTL